MVRKNIDNSSEEIKRYKNRKYKLKILRSTSYSSRLRWATAAFLRSRSQRKILERVCKMLEMPGRLEARAGSAAALARAATARCAAITVQVQGGGAIAGGPSSSAAYLELPRGGPRREPALVRRAQAPCHTKTRCQ
jgi:hypothetical protein